MDNYSDLERNEEHLLIRNEDLVTSFKCEVRNAKCEMMVRKTYHSVFCVDCFQFLSNPFRLF